MSAEDRRGRPIAQWRPRVPGNTDVGTRLVCVQLQVEHLHQLPGRGTDTVHGAIADQLASQARRLDDVQTRIVHLADALRRDLQRVIDGRDAEEPSINGLLHNSAPTLDLLAARRTELHRSLTNLVEIYKGLPPFEAQSDRQRAASLRGTVKTSSTPRTPSAPPKNTGEPHHRHHQAAPRH
ncbi:hypothetical protein OU787_25715 [Kitasatospora sp. YST-16]|uniref:hypothetical protein n=1 Tax=Kitasatospora sp. YST-16 TaxID=2998080 RepID=UPI0022839E7D|nr:hypothetical protein [Kitasatospora sp. YST-16]WAL74594.1 hypothetical protein OU787_25715 [Kitasatospora sp. YST-16]WNW40652.1 hypothetical protein RKE32_25650 [Streptomyces sp. Li-HN-5-13]